MTGTNSGRKSGGQPGNLNAYKHGFYSQRLRSLSLGEAEKMGADVEAEIAMLRALLEKYLYLANVTTKAKEMGNLLELAGRAMVRIGNLVKIQRAIMGEHWDESVEDILARVLDDMARDDQTEGRTGFYGGNYGG